MLLKCLSIPLPIIYFFRIFWLLSIHCPNLQGLGYCSDEFPPSSEALWSLGQGCRILKYLQLPPVLGSPNASVFNDNCLVQLGHAWPELLSLTVGGSEVSACGLVKVGMLTQPTIWFSFTALCVIY